MRHGSGSLLCESRADCPELWDAALPYIEALLIVITLAIAVVAILQVRDGVVTR